MSTNRIDGDAPNAILLAESVRRYDYSRREENRGVSEACRIDRSLHSLFGALTVAADILTQEYGWYIGLTTVCFQCGCLHCSHHSGGELHRFLRYLVKVAEQA